jgi:hypothetical protein
MTPSAPGLQNKKLLLVAILLGVIVAIVYNVHIGKVRDAASKTGGAKLRLLRDIRAGQKLKIDDVEQVTIPASAVDLLKDVVDGSDDRLDDIRRMPPTLNQAVSKGNWLRYEYLPTGAGGGPAAAIGKKHAAVALPVDERVVPGDILRVGGYVNLLAQLPDARGNYNTYRVVEGLLVHSIQGEGPIENPGGVGAVSPSRSTYRTITVQAPLDLSLQLKNIESHARRNVFSVEVINPNDRPEAYGVLSKDPAVVAAASSSANK